MNWFANSECPTGWEVDRYPFTQKQEGLINFGIESLRQNEILKRIKGEAEFRRHVQNNFDLCYDQYLSSLVRHIL